MTDQEFREKYRPLQVPATYDSSSPLTEQILYALADLGEATADAVVRKLYDLRQSDGDKEIIARVHDQLTAWHEEGLLSACQQEGELKYSLQKITEANDGAVDPELLAPGLD